MSEIDPDIGNVGGICAVEISLLFFIYAYIIFSIRMYSHYVLNLLLQVWSTDMNYVSNHETYWGEICRVEGVTQVLCNNQTRVKY